MTGFVNNAKVRHYSCMAEPKFVPKEGQVDYTNIRYAPVINCVVKYQQKILLVQRSKDMRLYPGYWNGVSGFLDTDESVEEKAHEELEEELGIAAKDIVSINRGKVIVQEGEEYNKTWIIFPVLVEVKTTKITLDWEASDHKWLMPEEAKQLNLMPGFDEVLNELLGV